MIIITIEIVCKEWFVFLLVVFVLHDFISWMHLLIAFGGTFYNPRCDNAIFRILINQMKLMVDYFPEYICWLDSFALTRTPSGFFHNSLAALTLMNINQNLVLDMFLLLFYSMLILLWILLVNCLFVFS